MNETVNATIKQKFGTFVAHVDGGSSSANSSSSASFTMWNVECLFHAMNANTDSLRATDRRVQTLSPVYLKECQ